MSSHNYQNLNKEEMSSIKALKELNQIMNKFVRKRVEKTSLKLGFDLKLKSGTKSPKVDKPFDSKQTEMTNKSRSVTLCDVCDRKSSIKYSNGSLCSYCTRFYQVNTKKSNKLICNYDNKCLIYKDRINKCMSCRWNRCMAIISDKPSDNGNDLSDKTNENVDLMDTTSSNSSRFQPIIPLTPLKSKSSTNEKKSIVKTSVMNNSENVCQICGVISSNSHYGIVSCNACYRFFSKYINKEKSVPLCANNCRITKDNGINCISCRVEAYIKAGFAIHHKKIIEDKPVVIDIVDSNRF